MSVADRKVMEAMLLLADEPVSAGLMGEVLERSTAEVQEILVRLAQEFVEQDRGFVLREVAGGWRLYTDPDCAPWLERFVQTYQHARLTGAALEVLAIVAYRQPISRTQISEIRGVDSDGVVKTLCQRGLLSEQGRDSSPGTPVLFSVSDMVLERLGLRSVDELPTLSGFMPSPEAVEDMEARLSPNA
jgi:segregation and condensation protein B